MIRLVATDIDGTLLRDGSHDLHPAYYDMIRRLRETGVYFCVCSGRQYDSIRRLFDPVSDDIFYIAENGSLVRTRTEVLHSWNIDPDAYLPLLHDIRKIPDAGIVVSGKDLSWVESGEDSHLFRLLKDSYHYTLENIPDLAKVPDDVVKISVFHRDGDRGLQALSRSRWKDVFSLTASGVTWMDICPKESGKGTALAFLQEHLGVGREDTLYFGDNMNDLSAFRQAGLAGTVANARPEVQEAADFVGGRFEDLGVLRELERIFFSGEGHEIQS